MIAAPDVTADIVDSVERDLGGHDVRVAARRSAFDALTCMVAGGNRSPGSWTAGESGAVSLIGTDRYGTLLDAIAYNSATCHLLDRDDLHWPSVVHAGGVVWPVAFGVGEAVGAKLGDVLDAGALGYQIAVRTSLLLGGGHRRSFHATTTCGTAAAAAVATRLSEGATADIGGSVRAAASVMGGTRQALAELSDTATGHRAHATVAGVIAARFRGALPVERPLEGAFGFAAATGIELDRATLGPTLLPAVAESTVRTHPVSGFAHTMVDALLSLAPVDARDVESVRVELPQSFLAANRREAPREAQHAKWHFATVAAVTITGGLRVREFPWPISGVVRDLAERIQIVAAAPEVGAIGARATVDTTDGSTRTATCEVPRGHPGAPLTDDDLVTRAVELAAWDDDGTARGVLDHLGRSQATVAEFLDFLRDSVRSR